MLPWQLPEPQARASIHTRPLIAGRQGGAVEGTLDLDLVWGATCGGAQQVPAPTVQQLALHSLDDRLGRPRSAKVRRMRARAHGTLAVVRSSLLGLPPISAAARFPSAAVLPDCRHAGKAYRATPIRIDPIRISSISRAQMHPLQMNGVRSARSWRIVRNDCLLPEVVSCPELADSVSHVGLWMSGGGALLPEPKPKPSLSRWPPCETKHAPHVR